MGRYVARRLIQFIPVILGTLFLLHILSTLTIQIVDPVRALAGEQHVNLGHPADADCNLDDPCLQQTGNPCGLFIGPSAVRHGQLRINRGREVTELFLSASRTVR
jgi:peptide/nickel transport system permease protein/oligopeptide transport system permease protein